MSIVVREFDEMVEDTLQRIVDANVGITNVSVGTVVRTIVESILPELEGLNYNVVQAYGSKLIDNASDEDLEDIGDIFGIVRNPATSAKSTVLFSTTEPSASNIYIQYNQVISTKQNSTGVVYEAMVTDENLFLPAGSLSISANIEMVEPGIVYLPIGSINVINTSIIGISNVINQSVINGGTDIESDENLRVRIKGALLSLGRGTCVALKNAISNITGVSDVVILDMADGVATVSAVIVTDIIPPSQILVDEIESVIESTKSGGILVTAVYPTIVTVNVTITTTDGDNNIIGGAIVAYINSLGIADPFIINQMEKRVLMALDNESIDISTSLPTENITITGTQAIKGGIITVNGVVYGGT